MIPAHSPSQVCDLINIDCVALDFKNEFGIVFIRAPCTSSDSSLHYLHYCFLSLAYAENLITRHVDLLWNIDFASETVSGEVLLHFDIVAPEIDRIVS